MDARSLAEAKHVARRCLSADALPKYVHDLARIVLWMVQDIERTTTLHPATMKTLNGVVECLLEEAAAYTTLNPGSE
ncbi:MAG: hypothetical protein A2045_16635 [Rhodocyclales bacterium GWA2_65_20]|nr:MAG: hypothetical protein A2045_16635 [Rhodocyclales bacterium GWA2_65_20]